MDLSRREFCGLLGSMVISPGLFSGLSLPSSPDSFRPELSTVSIRISDLPKDLIGFRIGFLSDLHFSAWLQDEIIADAFKLASESSVDVLLLGGDYIWSHEPWVESVFSSGAHPKYTGGSKQRRADKLADKFTEIVGKLGLTVPTYAVLGNHDLWWSPKILSKKLGEAHIQVLRNERVVIDRGSSRLEIVGIDDYLTGIPDYSYLKDLSARNSIRIALTHNPDLFSVVSEAKEYKFDLGLAGHTHGGQIKLPAIGALTYRIDDLRFKEGYQELRGKSFYTSRGIGAVGVPFRLNCPPEVSVIELNPL
jgi:predicted MPP superfamily phosphohydrolase